MFSELPFNEPLFYGSVCGQGGTASDCREHLFTRLYLLNVLTVIELQMRNEAIEILLIEDTPSDAALVERMLRGDLMFSSLHWVQSLEAARHAMLQRRFDLILTDLGLPDSSGIQTVVRLREINEELPVIALTGHDDDGLGLAAIRAGANDYILKSVVSKQVISRAISYTMERFRMTEKLQEANRQLEGKNERLAQMYQMSQQFVDNVSHEFRTPLTVIREFAAIVRDGIDGPVTEQQENRLATLINRTDDLARMVDDLLDTSRLEAGLLKAFRSEHDLAEIVGQVEKMLRPRAEAKRIDLRVAGIADGLKVFCDEEKLRRCLINLLVNAVKFTPVDGQIVISTAMADSDRVKITVADNGPGIPADDLTRIFKRFQQVESHHRMASCRGFGLGLSIARALASLNLGSLQVASVEGQGSQFSVLVPVAKLESILNCYLDQRELSLDGFSDISLIEVGPAKFDIAHEIEILEAIDDFLRSTVKSHDLVVQKVSGRWLVYSCNTESSLPGFTNRLTDEWSKLKRNHFGTALPDLLITRKLTTQIDSGRDLLKQAVRTQSAEHQVQLNENQQITKQVLIIDDELEVAAAIESRLRANGFEVTAVHDGEAGLKAVQDSRPDAILLDIRMPRMDGLTVLKNLKSNPATAATPVIVLSASLHDKQNVLECGANFFINKPFQSKAILAALESAMVKNIPQKTREETDL